LLDKDGGRWDEDEEGEEEHSQDGGGDYGRVWFGFFLNSFFEKLAVERSWLLGKAGG
jgi:hypothetical protein